MFPSLCTGENHGTVLEFAIKHGYSCFISILTRQDRSNSLIHCTSFSLYFRHKIYVKCKITARTSISYRRIKHGPYPSLRPGETHELVLEQHYNFEYMCVYTDGHWLALNIRHIAIWRMLTQSHFSESWPILPVYTIMVTYNRNDPYIN